MYPTCPLSKNNLLLLDNIPKAVDARMDIVELEDAY